MFEYAIDVNKRNRPTKTIVASWVLSCAAHTAAVVVVIQNPWLLQGGLHHSFRPLSLISGVFSSAKSAHDDDWRTVAIIRSTMPMPMPSEATLRKNIPDRNKTGTEAPVSVRWETKDLPVRGIPAVQAAPKPENRQEPDIKLPPSSAQIANAAAERSVTESGQGVPKIEVSDAAAGRPTMIPLPAPSQGAELNSAIKAINEGSGVKPPAETTQSSTQVFASEQEAIRSEGSGLFDNKGFPLGEYANLVIERVKGNWMIPSNLRKSQGRTTVIFYIDRDGRSADARIVISSGSDSLDIAALSAILGSNPFPPLPKGFPGSRVGAKFVFSYNERQ